jgi:tetratricopeptide (TPR) repeat protein
MDCTRFRPAMLVLTPLLAGLWLCFAPVSGVVAGVLHAQEGAEDFLNRGAEKLQRRDLGGALADFTEALRVNPNFATAYANRGAVRAQLGDYQGAVDDSTQALRIDPSLVAAYLNRSAARARLGDYRGAIEDGDQALRLDPNNVEVYSNRGAARADSGDLQGAIEDFNQALQMAAAHGQQPIDLAETSRGPLEAGRHTRRACRPRRGAAPRP